jgi:SAM-dependent methyltransferase
VTVPAIGSATTREAPPPAEPPVPRTDPFIAAGRQTASGRPRLLSHLGRWGRARRWLPSDATAVLDIGCAAGYGSAAIQGRGASSRVVVGVERDPEHLASARERHPWITVVEGDATSLPVADGVADAVTMLDIVEHLERPQAALAEAWRVLKPDGVLIVSVPHRGLLHRFDALNLYESLRRRRPGLEPLAPATTSGGHEHRHFRVADMEALLAPRFELERVTRRGLGLQELATLGMLAATARRPALVRGLAVAHLALYLIDDLLPLGPLGYHLMVLARPRRDGAVA